MRSWALLAFFACLLATPAAHAATTSFAASPEQEIDYVELAQVTEVISQTSRTIPGTATQKSSQTLRAHIVGGPERGEDVTVNNDYLNLKPGDYFYAMHSTGGSDALDDTWNVQEPYRLPALEVLGGIFLLAVAVFGGRQGIRGILSLVASLAAIFWILLPGILAGYSPIVLSVAISGLIVGAGSYITHGFSRTTSAAVLGMLVTLVLTGALAYWAVHASQLTGYSTEGSTYLHFATSGGLNFVSLLLGGIMIGILGILYDAAIGQAVTVEELSRAATHYSPWQLYARAERVGREHIGALVNTLAIAYVGISLPLLLLLHFSNLSLAATINQDIFATELVRMMVGSIGLILAVPITTGVSILMLARASGGENLLREGGWWYHPDMKLILHWIIATIAIGIASYILPGVTVTIAGAVILAVVLGALNLFIRPLLVLLTLPINILTLGLFTIVINAFLVWIAALIVPGFTVKNFWWALLFALVLALVNWVFHAWGRSDRY